MTLIDIPGAIKETNRILSGQTIGQAIFSLLLTTVLLAAVIFYSAQFDPSEAWAFSRVPIFSFLDSDQKNFALELLAILGFSFLLNFLLWKLNFGAPAFDPKTDAYTPIRNQLTKSEYWDITFFGFFLNGQDKTGRVRMLVNESYKKLEITLEFWDNIELKGDGRDVAMKLDNGKLSVMFLIDATAKNTNVYNGGAIAPRLKYLVQVMQSSSSIEGKVLFIGDWYRLKAIGDDDSLADHGSCELESI
jgi:hypothetical protein